MIFLEMIYKIGRKLIRISGIFISRYNNIMKGDMLPYYCPCCDTHLEKYINGGMINIQKFLIFIDTKI